VLTMRIPIAIATVILGVSWIGKNVVAFAPSIFARNKLSQSLDMATLNTETTEQVASDVDIRTCLETLEKRMKQGPSALSSNEVLNLDASIARIVETLNQSNDEKLRTAVSQMDVSTVSALLDAGMEMDEATTNRAFWSVVQAVDRAEEQDKALSGNIATMLHHVFDADLKHLLQREKISTNVTCMQPDESEDDAGAARRMNYIFDDGDHKNLPLTKGRKCEDGACCDACSRNIFPTFAKDSETDLEVFPEMASLTFNNLRRVSSASIIQFVRLIERVRRTMAHEYGLPLKSLLPLQAYSRKYVAGTTQQGGGGGEGDFVTLHTDEATHSGYHYSCVIYLSSQGIDFEGGDFIFNDPLELSDEEKAIAADDEDDYDEEDDALYEAFMAGGLPEGEDKEIIPVVETVDEDAMAEEIRSSGRDLTPFSPTRGSAVIFSSGWENMHEVERITSGTRYAVPAFFTTCPVPDIAYEQMAVGKPKTTEDIADDWLHLLLAHRKEEPIESTGRVKELLMKWHFLCSPLSEH